jgi:uncharacterized membrane protein YfcA
MLFALLGAKFANTLDDWHIQLVVACYLQLVSFYFFYKGRKAMLQAN